MNDEQWERLLDSLEVKFDLKKGKETFITEDDLGHEMENEVERVEFETPEGLMRVERLTRPLILDKKVHYGKSSSGQGKTEFVLSETEKTHKVTLYKFDEDTNEWQEIKPEGGFKF